MSVRDMQRCAVTPIEARGRPAVGCYAYLGPTAPQLNCERARPDQGNVTLDRRLIWKQYADPEA